MHAFWALSCLCLLASPSLAVRAQAADLIEEERALCRPDALRLCLCQLGDAEAPRQCLPDNQDNLSAPCLGLLKPRGT